MKFTVIIASRTGSKRLPGKVLLPILGIPVIAFIIKRIKTSIIASQIICATTDLSEDDKLAEVAQNEGALVFRGSSEDVLSRYVGAAAAFGADYVVRVTGDCPFVDGATLDHVLEQCRTFGSFDLVTTKPQYPHGIDYEIYPRILLEEINGFPLVPEDREHHLNYIYRNEGRYRIHRLIPPKELCLKDSIFLLDTADDYKQMKDMLNNVSDIYIPSAVLIRKYLHEN